MLSRLKLAAALAALCIGMAPLAASATELTLFHTWSNESEMAALNTIVKAYGELEAIGVIETRGGASHSGCSSAGQLLIWAGSRCHRCARTQVRMSAARSRTLRRAVYELTRTSRSLALPPRATRP